MSEGEKLVRWDGSWKPKRARSEPKETKQNAGSKSYRLVAGQSGAAARAGWCQIPENQP